MAKNIDLGLVVGKTPYVGDNGHWFVGDQDTDVPAQGPKGEQGANGYVNVTVNGTTAYITTE